MSVFVVTGAAGGIGSAVAHTVGGEGHTIVAVDLSPSLADRVVDLEADGVVVLPVQADLTTDEGLEAVVAAVRDAGPLQGLVNNAGITRDARLVNMTDQAFEAVLAVNLGAVYRLTTALEPLFSEGSAIVNVSSRAYLGNFGQFNYSMSKGGLVGLTRAMAVRLAPRTRVNAVAPGLIGTEMVLTIPQETLQKMVDNIPLARMGEPGEVADLVAYLLSDRSSYITGHVHVIGGGRSLT
ncbi:MAG: SDR family oxidoreductase [Acidimicrobiia bacterium]|nr:SDR family oxidoreductase [Acidimicrobiia bacterium]